MASHSHSNNKVDYLVLNIKELIKDGDEGLRTDVCVYRVPKSLSSANPEAFTPQFVGLGPYHHRRPEFITEQKLKATAVKRVLKNLDDDHLRKLVTKLRESNLAAEVRNCYDTSTSLEFQQDDDDDDDDVLLYLITVDTVYLYDLLCSFEIKEEDNNGIVTKFDLQEYSTLIGILPLVNAAGIEFTKDAIIRDVFMLENQIPIHILNQIIITLIVETDELDIAVDDRDVYSEMLRFCRALCPLVNIDQQLSNVKHVHLLDLMYHLIVPDLKPNPDHPPKPDEPNLNQPNPDEPGRKTCCFKCCLMLVLLFLLGWIILYLVKAILGQIFRALRKLLDLLADLTRQCYPAVERFYDILSNCHCDIPFLKPFTEFVGQVVRVGKLCMQQESTNSDMGTDVTIPSVMKLYQAGICFQPAPDPGISSIQFDEEKCKFYLPKIRVDVNSEVIMRNLVAYESLTKSHSLIFTSYVELMRDIIKTAEDVKLLVDHNIIIHQTQLSHEQVAQLFNGMSKSIRPTNTPELEKHINNVNNKFHKKRKLHRFMTKYGRFLAVLAALALLVLTAMQTYCSLYTCSATSNSGQLPQHYGYDYRNNYLISSM